MLRGRAYTAHIGRSPDGVQSCICPPCFRAGFASGVFAGGGEAPCQ